MRWLLISAPCVVLFTCVLTTRADNGAGARVSSAVKSVSPMHVTPERSAAAMTFVEQHHPELAELLVYLRKKLPHEYQKAVRDLFRTSERLARLRENGDETRHNLELQIWQVRSRTQLLTARLRTTSDARLESELRDLLERQFELRLAQLELDRSRALRRVEKLNHQISEFKMTREQVIERHFRQLATRRDKAAGSKATRKPDGRKGPAKVNRSKQDPTPTDRSTGKTAESLSPAEPNE